MFDVIINILLLLCGIICLFLICGFIATTIFYFTTQHEEKKLNEKINKDREGKAPFIIDVTLNYKYREWAHSEEELKNYLMHEISEDELSGLTRGAINKKFAIVNFKIKKENEVE